MPHARTLTAGIATLGAIVLIAGCGGGSSTLSAEDFRSQADAICADANTQLAGVADPASSDAFLAYLRARLPIQEAQLSKLEALKPPADLEGTYTEALDLLKQRQAAVAAAADRIEGGEGTEAVVKDVSADIDGINDQADAKAKELGLKVCGNGDAQTGTTPGTTGTAPATTTAPAGGGGTTATGGETVAPAAYLADVRTATLALKGFGDLLQNSTSIQELAGNSAAAQEKVDEFDATIGQMDTYTLSQAGIEKQRAGLVSSGPALSDILRRFTTAAAAGDLTQLDKLLPELEAAVKTFYDAANNVG